MNDAANLPTTQAPMKQNALKALDRIAIVLPPEVALPVGERVYAMEVTLLDDPVAPTPRDLAVVERLGALMCEPLEVIAIAGLTKEQFNHSDILKSAWARGRERAKARLRLMQWDAAAMGSERMLVHLGKQYLEQTERTETNNVDSEQRLERKTVRDKLADAINRAATSRAAGGDDGGRAGAVEEAVVVVGTGQPTPPTP